MDSMTASDKRMTALAMVIEVIYKPSNGWHRDRFQEKLASIFDQRYRVQAYIRLRELYDGNQNQDNECIEIALMQLSEAITRSSRVVGPCKICQRSVMDPVPLFGEEGEHAEVWVTCRSQKCFLFYDLHCLLEVDTRFGVPQYT